MAKRFPVSIIILTHNNLGYTRQCLEELEQTTEAYEVIVIDNASSDGTVEYLKAWEEQDKNRFGAYNSQNRGFAGGCNQGVSLAHFGTVCLLNNDVVPFPGWLDALRDVLEKGVGAVGAKLILPDHNLQHCGIAFNAQTDPVPRYIPFHRYIHYPEEIKEANLLEEVPAATAACLLTNKTVWDRVGGMDEGYKVANFEDVDFNLKLRDAGLKVIYQPAARLIHYWGSTVKAKDADSDSPRLYFQANFDRLMMKWADKLGRGLACV